jgi:hypothetical protein
MSKGFDNNAVGLSQLYSQLRTKTITNAAGEAGATIRAVGANPPAVDLAVAQPGAPSFRIRVLIDNGGQKEALSAPVRVLLASAAATFTKVSVNGGLGTIVGQQPGALGDQYVEVVLLPGTGGQIDVTVQMGGAQNGVSVVILAGADMVNATINVTNPV